MPHERRALQVFFAPLRLDAVALALLLAGCDRPPSDRGLPEWTPADHDFVESPPQSGAGPGAATGGPIDTQVIDAIWTQRCVGCHGPFGKGDGPLAEGPVGDLTQGPWQQGLTDQTMAQAIRKGRGTMPAFELSEAIVKGLVERIRAGRVARVP